MPTPAQPGQVPTIITKPNQRFATTALSTKYRINAVNGELLKDDVTGEIFYKRHGDGKVVSFFQNKERMQDLVLDLRVLLSTNMGFRYPAGLENAFFIDTNYDLVAINKEKLINIYNDDIEINNENTESMYTFHFKLSAECNGFFMEVNTRDCDKPIVEVITNYYNTAFKNYIGDSPLFLAEKDKFRVTSWEQSNAVVHYHCVCTKGETTHTYGCTSNIRLNEQSMIDLPDLDIATDFNGRPETIEVFIDSITFDKLHFMITNKDLVAGTFPTLLDKYIYEDGHIEVSVANVMQFIDKPEDWTELGNEIVLAFIDTPYLHQYMGRMMSLTNNGDFIFSIRRPYADEWKVNGVWAEMVRIIDTNGNIKNTGSENSGRLGDLEDVFGPNRIHHGRFTFLPSEHDDFLFDDRSEITYDA